MTTATKSEVALVRGYLISAERSAATAAADLADIVAMSKDPTAREEWDPNEARELLGRAVLVKHSLDWGCDEYAKAVEALVQVTFVASDKEDLA